MSIDLCKGIVEQWIKDHKRSEILSPKKWYRGTGANQKRSQFLFCSSSREAAESFATSKLYEYSQQKTAVFLFVDGFVDKILCKTELSDYSKACSLLHRCSGIFIEAGIDGVIDSTARNKDEFGKVFLNTEVLELVHQYDMDI